MKITNVSNIAAFGAQWTDASGTVWQLVSSRGSWDLTFGSKAEDGKWAHHGLVVAPERFGFTRPPRTWREFLPVAEAFVRAGTEQEATR